MQTAVLDRLPDFLNLEQGGEFDLLGQDELSPSTLENAFKDQIAKAAATTTWTEQETERILLAAARVGQHRFAQNVLANCGGQCVFCGLNPGPFGGKRMLLAGHIKPWKDSTSTERLDLTNGLAACPSHDVAFDTGLITVDASLQVHVSSALAVLSKQTRSPASTTDARHYATRSCSRSRPSCPAASTSTGTKPTSSPPDQALDSHNVGSVTTGAEPEGDRDKRHHQRTLFDGTAERYEESRPGYPSRVVESVTTTAGLTPNAVVLEIGCGTGQLTGRLAGHGFHLTAIDIAPP